MSEQNDPVASHDESQDPRPGVAPTPLEAPAAAPHEPTGNGPVDAVLDSLAGLDGASIDEHVAVFERAHEGLRGALASAAEDES